ncbi:hypothetical protein SRABI27_00950 [Pedobacter sp. Bi27]|uniref:hypothetical protein n=1 Tax=Pedobacter sp. Bi27 TaxID=2822351 RepID=UPI001DF97EF2|nr:hypothetical protein [Pedobacter sp. Bi27]CAH0168379.1 hypothetical protein SRABI27_00950 [Pedobacter sp. Bi27]
MKKQHKIILGVLACMMLVAIALMYKLHWFGAGMKPQHEATRNPDRVAEAISDIHQVTLNPKKESPKEAVQIEFPLYGNTIEDFVPGLYKIAMDTKGLLNNDELEDVVLVLQNKTDSTDLRPTLILLKQPEGGYRLYASSLLAIGAAYINGDYQQYDSEDISIDQKRNLIISTYGSGPVGNRETRYRFIDNELVFTYMETFNAGAGQQTRATYDVLNRKVTVEDINTMKEDMPATVSHGTLPQHPLYFFKELDPTTVFSE